MDQTVIYCDECKQLATRATRNLIQIESGSEWADWEPYGNWHYGCDDHPPQKSVRYGLNGRVIHKPFVEHVALSLVPQKNQ